MKHARFLFLILLTTTVVAQDEVSRKTHFNLKKGIALQGYDPVSYFSSQPREGKDEFTASFKGVTYLFATGANREIFNRSPEKYEPAYGGWCAFAMGESGEKVKIDPDTYKIIDGKLYLFYNFWGNNTLQTWNKSESELKSKGDRNWKKFIP
jgi:YHS domain-containing protein